MSRNASSNVEVMVLPFVSMSAAGRLHYGRAGWMRASNIVADQHLLCVLEAVVSYFECDCPAGAYDQLTAAQSTQAGDLQPEPSHGGPV